ncbi:MAG: sugar-binding protein [Isosphaerales bacterium]
MARDSSLYEIAVKAQGGRCVYELRIPWSELAISPAFGGKFGFAVQLNDNDGHGPAAQMNWGGGLSPAWSPAGFGVVTLTE